jgi:hypothetical protein
MKTLLRAESWFTGSQSKFLLDAGPGEGSLVAILVGWPGESISGLGTFDEREKRPCGHGTTLVGCVRQQKGVVDVARYYHHGTVRANDRDDDIHDDDRKELDITRATNYKPEGSMIPPNTTRVQGGTTQSRSTSRKKSSSRTNAPYCASKRTCSSSPTKAG